MKEFATKGDKHQAHCKACQKEVSDAHYQRNKEKIKARTKTRKERVQALVPAWIWDYLLEHPCACGESDLVVLDFDHRDPATKTASVADLIAGGYDLPWIEAEVAKCDVLCSNCHRKRTAAEGSFWRVLHVA